QAMSTMEDGLQPVNSADKYQVVIHIERGNEQHGSIESGAHHLPLSPATARRLCCDASLVPVLEDASGNVLNVGRKTRAIPPSIRRALQLRDHGCRFPGCCESRYVDAHHVQHCAMAARRGSIISCCCADITIACCIRRVTRL
ncbi:MAG: DUF222 domain-containing protein, partial [Gammaproteobacteria bacterium]|nr:DUF222 domain-containing protein [Gammaproteobacteria bacterium]